MFADIDNVAEIHILNISNKYIKYGRVGQMKKLLFLVFIPLFCVGILYAQNSATLQLRGIITNNINVSFNVAQNNLIDLRTVQSLVLGSITLGSNQGMAYSVTITSQNGGAMRNLDAATQDTLPYSLSFGAYENIDLSTGFQMLFSPTTDSRSTQYPLQVNFPKMDSLSDPIAAGMYEDIVTITVSAT